MVHAIHKIKKAIHPFTVECGARIVYDFSERWEEVTCKNCLAIKERKNAPGPEKDIYKRAIL